jgi:ankyrin repeat protein
LCLAAAALFLVGCSASQGARSSGAQNLNVPTAPIQRFFAENGTQFLDVEVFDYTGHAVKLLELSEEDQQAIIRSLANMPPQECEASNEGDDSMRGPLATGGYSSIIVLQGCVCSLPVYLMDEWGFNSGLRERGGFMNGPLADVLERIYRKNGLLYGYRGRCMKHFLEIAGGRSQPFVNAHTKAENKEYDDEKNRLAHTYELSRIEAAVLEDTTAYLKAGGNVNANVDGRGNTLLHVAARGGYRSVVEKLLVYGANANARNDFGVTPLHRATQPSNEACAAMLIFRGADVNAQTQSGETPLHFLSLGGFRPEGVPLATMLMLNGADLELQAKNGRVIAYGQVLGATPMQQAIRLGKWEVARALAAAGGPLDVFAAASLGAADMLAGLLKKEPDLVRAKGPFGDSPLHFAARGGQAEVARQLIEGGAAVNVPGEDGWYPLHAAAWGNHEKVVRLLIERGADVNAKDRSGKTPLWHAPEAMVRLLVEKGTDLNARDAVGWTLLHRRAAAGQEDWVKFLVSLKADPNIKTEEGETAADLAGRNRYDGVVEALNANSGSAK